MGRVVTLLLSSLLFSNFLIAQYFQPSLRGKEAGLSDGSVNGTVVDPQGHPLGGISVEVTSLNSAVPVASTYTQPNGYFELYNIPAGNYQVIAEGTGGSQVRDVVAVSFGQLNVQLRMPASSTQQYGSAATVSVAQMMVPEKAGKLYWKARQNFVSNHNDEAKKQVEKALQICPKFAEALTLRGLVAWRLRQGDRGQHDFEEAIQIDPHYGVPYLALGSLYNSESHFDDALRTLGQATAISPNVWQGYFEMAKASIGKGMYAKGLELAQKAESLGGSSFAAIHLLKAYALIPQKLYTDARQELQAFLAHDPNGSDAQRAQQLLAKLSAAEATTGQPTR